MTGHAPKSFALIVGSMKCGTTTLFDLLARSPQVCPSREKEPNFFVSPYKWALGPDAYEALFEGFDPARHRCALEASTDYAKLPYFDYALDRMAGLEARGYRYKFVYVIRDPRRRIESHVHHYATTGYELFHVAWDDARTPQLSGLSRPAIEISRYAYHIDQFKARFGDDSIHTVFFEDLAEDPDGVVDGVCDFLGLDRFEAPSGVHANKARATAAAPLWSAIRDNPAGRAAYRFVPSGVRSQLAARFSRAPLPPKPVLTPDQEAAVLSELGADIAALRDRHGLDAVARWGIDLG